MTPELLWLTAATAVFILLHTAVSSTPLRAWLVGAMGEGPYLGLFSLASAACLVWMSMAYAAAPHLEIWEPTRAARLAALAVMTPVFIFLALGLTTRNPAALGGGSRKGQPKARGILRITRHPVQWALLIWSILHVILNGHLAALIFFGGLALLSAMGPLLIDRKRRAAMGEAWEPFAAVTSNIPFAAILVGRNKLVWGEIGWKGLLLGLGLYLLLGSLHPYVIGLRVY